MEKNIDVNEATKLLDDIEQSFYRMSIERSKNNADAVELLKGKLLENIADFRELIGYKLNSRGRWEFRRTIK